MVQIHSPRPTLLELTTYHTHKSERPHGAGPGAQWFKSICPDHSFASQINAVRCVRYCEFNFICTDNTDNITTSLV